MIPAKAATAEPIANVISTTSLKLMPMACAVSLSCATARIASPSLVLVITNCTAAIIANPASSRITLSRRRLQMTPVECMGRKQSRKGLRVRPIGKEQPHALAQHGSEHQGYQERVQHRCRTQRQHQIARNCCSKRRHQQHGHDGESNELNERVFKM